MSEKISIRFERRRSNELTLATRKDKRNRKNRERIEARYNSRSGHWRDSSSPTGYSQYCDYQPFGCNNSATCEYPCNGDC